VISYFPAPLSLLPFRYRTEFGSIRWVQETWGADWRGQDSLGEAVASVLWVFHTWEIRLLMELWRRCTYEVKNSYFHLKRGAGQRHLFHYDLSNTVQGCCIYNETLKKKRLKVQFVGWEPQLPLHIPSGAPKSVSPFSGSPLQALWELWIWVLQSSHLLFCSPVPESEQKLSFMSEPEKTQVTQKKCKFLEWCGHLTCMGCMSPKWQPFIVLLSGITSLWWHLKSPLALEILW
jgi:hypothetical protein